MGDGGQEHCSFLKLMMEGLCDRSPLFSNTGALCRNSHHFQRVAFYMTCSVDDEHHHSCDEDVWGQSIPQKGTASDYEDDIAKPISSLHVSFVTRSRLRVA